MMIYGLCTVISLYILVMSGYLQNRLLFDIDRFLKESVLPSEKHKKERLFMTVGLTAFIALCGIVYTISSLIFIFSGKKQDFAKLNNLNQTMIWLEMICFIGCIFQAGSSLYHVKRIKVAQH